MKHFILLAALPFFCSSSAQAEDFKGYPCTVDCSGHEAGYEWAEEKGIDDPSDCGGNSNSFIEGCQSYAEEQQGFPDTEDNSDFSSGENNEDESEGY